MNYQSILLIVLMIAAMYFLMIRPSQRQRKQQQDQLSQLQKGDKVITIGRLHGVVDEINRENRTVVLDCEGIFLTFDLSAIANVVPADEPVTDNAASATADSEEPADSTTEVDSSDDATESSAAE